MQHELSEQERVGLRERLAAAVRGEVLCDAVSLGLYATDASMYQITPLAVVLPRDRDDALAAVRVCAELGAAILPRGGGTSLSGQTIARAVVIDVSKYMNRLLDLNVAERWARVQPGIVLDELNLQLRPHGLHFAPDPATGSRATVGGMIANNAAGMRSIRYGQTIDHVESIDLALSTGEVVELGGATEDEFQAVDGQSDRKAALMHGFKKLIEANRDQIVVRFPKVRRRSGGYPLDAFTGPKPWNLARIVCGSEGTLGLVLEARVRLEPLPAVSGLCIAHFATQGQMLRAIEPIVGCEPSAVEVIDAVVLERSRASLLTRHLMGWIEGDPSGILIVEAQGETSGEVESKLGRIAAMLRDRHLGYAFPIMLDGVRQRAVWLMRKNALGLMTTVKGDRKPVAFIEDAAIPLALLPEYIESVTAICARYERSVSIFAHASVGVIHVRPLLDLHNRSELEILKKIQDEVFERVVACGGSWSGEHGDGMVRGAYNERFFGPQLYGAFCELKALFDPDGLMNPGKVVHAPPVDENLRYGGGYRWQFSPTMFHYREDGSVRQAIEQCTGVGACRQTVSGTMCPSYIATRDEEHSTRGRANALRLAMTGQLGPGAVTSRRLREVLELCLSCKACKAECPNHVDLARLKAEVTHAVHAAESATLRDRWIAASPRMAAWASGVLAPAVNIALGSAPVRWALDRFIGLDRRRRMPAYAREPLSRWWRRRARSAAPTPGRPRVALFADTYCEHHEPNIGQAAVAVLEAAGFAVELVWPGCCQRPALSKGFLDVAKRQGEQTMRRLEAMASPGVPIVVCEPSCAAALTDDLPDLIDDAALGERVARRVRLIDDFLADELEAGRAVLPWAARGEGNDMKILLHGHCHQKALYGESGSLRLLRAIPGATVRSTDAGCCGMAGAFGYEKEHYEMSVKIAEDRLLPALRGAEPGTFVAADGFSCRHQIRDLGAMQAYHVIELVRMALGGRGEDLRQ